MHLVSAPVTSHAPTQAMCLLLAYQLLSTSDITSTYTGLLLTVIQSGSKDLESGSFPVKTKSPTMCPGPVSVNTRYNVSVKVGLAEEFCALHLPSLTECTFLALIGA